MMSRSLTAFQGRLLQAWIVWRDFHGVAPSLRELRVTLGLSATGWIHTQLMLLVEAGYLRAGAPKAQRSISLTPHGRLWFEAHHKLVSVDPLPDLWTSPNA